MSVRERKGGRREGKMSRDSLPSSYLPPSFLFQKAAAPKPCQDLTDEWRRRTDGLGEMMEEPTRGGFFFSHFSNKTGKT